MPHQLGKPVPGPEVLEDRLADGTVVPSEIISKKKYYPTLERQDGSDQEKTIASQNFI